MIKSRSWFLNARNRFAPPRERNKLSDWVQSYGGIAFASDIKKDASLTLKILQPVAIRKRCTFGKGGKSPRSKASCTLQSSQKSYLFQILNSNREYLFDFSFTPGKVSFQKFSMIQVLFQWYMLLMVIKILVACKLFFEATKLQLMNHF